MPTGFESVDCTICRLHHVTPFSWGGYHLNLLHPLQIVQCRYCGLYFMSPRPNSGARMQLMQGILPAILQSYDNRTANYASVTTNRHNIFNQRLTRLAELVSTSEIPPPWQLLDVGASAGTLVALAKNKSWQVQGVEPSIEGTQAALRQNKLVLPQAKAEELPWANHSFDIVHAHHVFEHLEDPLLAAKEAWRVLKPGGFIFIEVPNQFDNIMFRRDRLLKRVPQRQRSIRSIHHLWFFSQTTLKRLLQQAGFTDVCVSYKYSWQAHGWRLPFSLITRVIGMFFGGGDLIYAYGQKPK